MLNIFKIIANLFETPTTGVKTLKLKDLVEGEYYTVDNFVICKYCKNFNKMRFVKISYTNIESINVSEKNNTLLEKGFIKSSEEEILIYNTYIESQKLRDILEVFQTSKEFKPSNIAQLVINRRTSQDSGYFYNSTIFLDLEDIQYFQNKYTPLAEKEHENTLKRRIEQTEKNLKGLKEDYANIIHNKTN